MAGCHKQQKKIQDSDALRKEFSRVDSLVRLYPDSAFEFYNRAVETSTDSTYKGTWLQRMANIQFNAGDYIGSNETAISSLKLFDTTTKRHFPNISYDYYLLATNCLNLGRYNDALKYYDLTIRYSDSSDIPRYLNNKGVVCMKKKDYDQAIELYEHALQNNLNDTGLNSTIISNLAKTRWLKDPSYQPLNEFHEARRLREIQGNNLGLNATYSHLADYYTKNNKDSALYYAAKMLDVAQTLKSPDDQAEALEKLIRLSPEPLTKKYFAVYDSLTDSLQLARTSASNRFADIRYAGQEARAANLRLEKDNSQKKLSIIRQRAIIYGTVLILVGLIVFGNLWYKRRKRFQEMQTRNAIKESELKTSKKVHDVVANGLYRIMNELEHRDKIDKEPLLNKIEGLYEQSRDISYEHLPAASSDYDKQVHHLLTSFANEETRVIVVGNEEKFWNKVTAAQKHEIQFVLEELMINMQKHSRAKNVVIRFSQENGTAFINYKDDGVGIHPDIEYGNGLKNTVSRIKSLNGQFNFGKAGGEGVSITISFPLHDSND
jgi:tetratricopeptide (TPR) repeat protein